MRKWAKTVNIKPLLMNGDLDEAKQAIDLLRSELSDAKWHRGVDPKLCICLLCEGTALLECAESADEFDEGLAYIYDWADENDVWLGP